MKTIVLIFRFLGLILFGVAGFYFGDLLTGIINQNLNTLPYAIGGAAILAVIGFVAMPYLTVYPINWLRSYLSKISGPTLVAALVGLVVGLIIAALFSIPIALLPKPFNSILPFVAVLVFGYLGVAIRDWPARRTFAMYSISLKKGSADQRSKEPPNGSRKNPS